ncbi:lipid A deacylase LpxR family protein [Pseudomonas sp. PDM31]|uniref:lipid A deacylase LpxR family protein n=1 Tax=Pseudomonas sp. PDM31 TaxID=2854778 RepID=UPI001C447CD8|nr:lipid A deacylase LpxR family protein [Pseudomonas sp. PDM31]MBV7479228.1 lipid A deacylase LpxR family protein [Pseudomonas sp. PDM31]
MQLWMPKLLVVIALTTPSVALSDVLSLKLENDVFSGGDDGHYSNGLELASTFKPQSDHWTQNIGSLIPGWGPAGVDLAAYRFGHQIYTPDDIEQSELQPEDRPYAGLMYFGVSVFKNTQLQGWRETGELDIDLGIVGPATGAEKIQRGVHHLTGSDEPNGWDHQLHNEPYVNVGFEKRWWLQTKLAGLDLEYGPSAGLTAGNLYTYAASGMGLRIGQGLERSYSLPNVAPSFSGNLYFQEGGSFAWYGFANLQGRYMAHNMLLDGNTWKDSASVDRREWVGDAQVGVAMIWSQWQAAFSTVWRTREFEGQNQHDQFGSLAISTVF